MTYLPSLAAALADRYRIERELGAGGMATVYLAHDVRHDRKVAVKVLRPELSAILGAERFLTEIKTTANLQHPHILSLFDSGEADGTVFYVMPYVEGESLRDRIMRDHQLPIDEAIRIATEVADALDYAHKHGIVHRDIKPENILLHGGHAMVADFGIALAASRVDGGSRMTETGMSLGTPHYMSPEQAMGEREITPKADIYALGCVLYEMLTAEPPFVGATAQAIFARVLTDEPRSLTLQRKTIPPHVEATVRKALQKLPADRFTSAAQFAESLAKPSFAMQETGMMVGASPRARKVNAITRAVPWVLFAATAVIAAVALTRKAPLPVKPVVRFGIAMPHDAQPVGATGSTIAMSPDGTRIVYVGKSPSGSRIYSRGLDQLLPVAIAGTDRATLPFFSSDGQTIGFRQGSRLVKVSLGGGPVTPICDVRGEVFGATWTGQDSIFFAVDSGLMVVPAAGGTARLVAKSDAKRQLYWPEALPNGRALLLTVVTGGSRRLGAWIRKSGEIRTMDQNGGYPRYVRSGFVVLSDPSGIVSSVPFDAERLVTTGPATPIAENIGTSVIGDRNLGVSSDGDFAVQAAVSAGSRLVLVDRTGTVRATSSDTGYYEFPRLAPDGHRVVVGRWVDLNQTARDLWILDLVQHTRTRLTFDTNAAHGVWSPDGRRVAYSRGNGSRSTIQSVFTDGSGGLEQIAADAPFRFPAAFEPTGGSLVIVDGARDIRRIKAGGAGVEEAMVSGNFHVSNPSLSPDGRWLAYQSDESGRNEIYVRSSAGGGGRWQVSLDGGTQPVWSPAGGEIFYRVGDAMFAAAVRTVSQVEIGGRTKLFDIATAATLSIPVTNYDVSRDGRAFLMLQDFEGDAQSVYVTLNLFAQQRKKP